MLIRNGLGDREETVKLAAADMIDAWLSVVSGDNGGDFMSNFMIFLGLFDLTCEEGITVAADALRSIFVTRVSAIRQVIFTGKSFVTCYEYNYVMGL
jgi:condensin complex subunit 3